MWNNLSVKKLLIILGVLCLHICVFFWLTHYQYPISFKANNSSDKTISVRFINNAVSTKSNTEVQTTKNDSDIKKPNLVVESVNIDNTKTKALPINSNTKKKIRKKIQTSNAKSSKQKKANANSTGNPSNTVKQSQQTQTNTATHKKAEQPDEQEPKQNEPFAHLLNQNLWVGDYNGNAYHQLNPNQPHVPSPSSRNNRNDAWSSSETNPKKANTFSEPNNEYLLDDDSFLDNTYSNEQANQNEEASGSLNSEAEQPKYNPLNSESPVSLLESAIQYKQQIKPQYPTLARRMNIEGKVTFQFTVDENGYVVEDSLLIINSTNDSFSASVKSALLQSTFYPLVQNGVAIPIDLIHTHHFNLND